MGCFEQSTPYTRRLSEPEKRWLAYALTKRSPAVSARTTLHAARRRKRTCVNAARFLSICTKVCTGDDERAPQPKAKLFPNDSIPWCKEVIYLLYWSLMPKLGLSPPSDACAGAPRGVRSGRVVTETWQAATTRCPIALERQGRALTTNNEQPRATTARSRPKMFAWRRLVTIRVGCSDCRRERKDTGSTIRTLDHRPTDSAVRAKLMPSRGCSKVRFIVTIGTRERL
jgi:hypothetical protein